MPSFRWRSRVVTYLRSSRVWKASLRDLLGVSEGSQPCSLRSYRRFLQKGSFQAPRSLVTLFHSDCLQVLSRILRNGLQAGLCPRAGTHCSCTCMKCFTSHTTGITSFSKTQLWSQFMMQSEFLGQTALHANCSRNGRSYSLQKLHTRGIRGKYSSSVSSFSGLHGVVEALCNLTFVIWFTLRCLRSIAVDFSGDVRTGRDKT